MIKHFISTFKARKRKLYTPNNDEEDEDLVIVPSEVNEEKKSASPSAKYRIVEICGPIQGKTKENTNATVYARDEAEDSYDKLWETVPESPFTIEEIQVKHLIPEKPKDLPEEPLKTLTTNLTSETKEDEIHSQLKVKLNVFNDFQANEKKSDERWQEVKFSFSMITQPTNNFPERCQMRFNSLEDVHKKRDSTILSKILSVNLISSRPNTNVERIKTESDPMTNIQVLEEEKKSKEKVPEQISNLLPVLRELFNVHASNPTSTVFFQEKKHFPEADRFVDHFISQNLVKKVENEAETNENSSSKLCRKIALSEKICKDQFEGFFQSLADDDEADRALIVKSFYNCETPSLSESAKKIKRNRQTNFSNYNEVILGIMKMDEPTPKTSESDDFDQFIHKEKVVQTHQKQKAKAVKKIMFKDQTNIMNIQRPLPAVKLVQTKLVTTRCIDELDKLSDKFKLSYSKDQKKSVKPPNHDETYFSVFYSGKPKLKMRSSTAQNVTSTINRKENLREANVKKAEEDLKRHKNVSAYLNEFCRAKFTD